MSFSSFSDNVNLKRDIYQNILPVIMYKVCLNYEIKRRPKHKKIIYSFAYTIPGP